MEKRVNTKFEIYLTLFKDELRNKITEFDDKEKVNEILQFIYDYERFKITKEDFMKKKRMNEIPLQNRCIAVRSNNEQCSRRKKKNCDYCGTHSKGLSTSDLKTEVIAKDIHGIIYYIDNNCNVYKTEDILSEKQNPEIIGKFINDHIVFKKI